MTERILWSVLPAVIIMATWGGIMVWNDAIKPLLVGRKQSDARDLSTEAKTKC